MRRLLPLAMIALTTSPALAQDPAARFVEAHRLAVLGAAANDPVLVFAAARLMQSLALRAAGPADWTASPSTPGTGPADWQDGATVPDPATATPLPGALNPGALFDTARNMAPPDSALRDAIAMAATEIPAAPDSLAVGELSSTDAAQVTLALPGGAPVTIGLVTRDGQFAYRLTDSTGATLCEDASTTAGRLCTLTLPESQTLTLQVTGTATWLLVTP